MTSSTFTFNHHPLHLQNSFIFPPWIPYSHNPPLPLPCPGNTVLLCLPESDRSRVSRKRDHTVSASLYRFIERSVMSSRILPVAACVRISFLLKAHNPSCVYHILFFPRLSFVPTFWLLWMMLLWTWASKALLRSSPLFLWGRYRVWTCWIVCNPTLTPAF